MNRRPEDVSTASTMTAIVNVYNITEDNEKASKWYFRSLEINKELDNKNGISVCLGGIGINYLHLKNYPKAESNLKEALLISEELGDLNLIMNQTFGLSELYDSLKRYDLAYKYHLQFEAAKDSLFNDEKSREIGGLEASHEAQLEEMEKKAKEEAEAKTKLEKTQRTNLLQYSGIVVLLLVIASIIALLGFVKVKPFIASAIIFFAFLLFFEFLLVLLDPTIDRYSAGEPGYKLLFNTGVAACIFPIHAFFERVLKKRIIKTQLK